jgi:hypothetical protein
MTSLQCSLTVLAWLLGLGGLAFAYVIHLANAMKTTAPPLSARSALLAVSPALLALVVLVAQAVLAIEAGNLLRAALWNLPAIIGTKATLIMTIAAWAGDRPAARRKATEKRMAAESRAMEEIWSRSGRLPQWNLQVERGIPTSIATPEGGSRDGTDWIIRFAADGTDHSVRVCSVPAAAGPHDLERHARYVLGDLARRLGEGWRPGPDDEPLVITVTG